MTDLQALTPVEIDRKLEALYIEEAKADQIIKYRMNTVHRAAFDRYVYVGRRQVWRMTDLAAIAECEANRDRQQNGNPSKTTGDALDAYQAAVAERDAILAQMVPLDDEYDRRPWPRYFSTQGTGAHIHSSMKCSTCNRNGQRTRFGWNVELSGRPIKDAIAKLKTVMCTVCFPEAPTLPKTDDDRCPGKAVEGSYARWGMTLYATCDLGKERVRANENGGLRKHKHKTPETPAPAAEAPAAPAVEPMRAQVEQQQATQDQTPAEPADTMSLGVKVRAERVSDLVRMARAAAGGDNKALTKLKGMAKAAGYEGRSGGHIYIGDYHVTQGWANLALMISQDRNKAASIIRKLDEAEAAGQAAADRHDQAAVEAAATVEVPAAVAEAAQRFQEVAEPAAGDGGDRITMTFDLDRTNAKLAAAGIPATITEADLARHGMAAGVVEPYPAVKATWADHGEPVTGIWHGSAVNDAGPNPEGQAVSFAVDTGAVAVTFASGFVRRISFAQPFWLAPISRRVAGRMARLAADQDQPSTLPCPALFGVDDQPVPVTVDGHAAERAAQPADLGDQVQQDAALVDDQDAEADALLAAGDPILGEVLNRAAKITAPAPPAQRTGDRGTPAQPLDAFDAGTPAGRPAGRLLQLVESYGAAMAQTRRQTIPGRAENAEARAAELMRRIVAGITELAAPARLVTIDDQPTARTLAELSAPAAQGVFALDGVTVTRNGQPMIELTPEKIGSSAARAALNSRIGHLNGAVADRDARRLSTVLQDLVQVFGGRLVGPSVARPTEPAGSASGHIVMLWPESEGGWTIQCVTHWCPFGEINGVHPDDVVARAEAHGKIAESSERPGDQDQDPAT